MEYPLDNGNFLKRESQSISTLNIKIWDRVKYENNLVYNSK